MNFLSDVQLSELAELKKFLLNPAADRIESSLRIHQAIKDRILSGPDLSDIVRQRKVLRRLVRNEELARKRARHLSYKPGDLICPPSQDFAKSLGGAPSVNLAGEKASSVYFVEAVGLDLIKVGVTTALSKRLGALAGMSPVPLKYLGACGGDIELERDLHIRFAEVRSHGEWFRSSHELRTEIAHLIVSRPRLDAGGCGDTQ